MSNIRSILPKRDELQSLLDATETDIIALTETWLTPNIESFEILPNFTVYRHDRVGRRGGGVLLGVKSAIHSRPVIVPCDIEMVWCMLGPQHVKLLVGVCYRPPDDSCFVTKLHDVLSSSGTIFQRIKLSSLAILITRISTGVTFIIPKLLIHKALSSVNCA